MGVGLLERLARRVQSNMREQGLVQAIQREVRDFRQARARRQAARICQSHVHHARGLEIGGPSSIFREDGILPLYHLVGGLDNCTFCADTIWEGRLSAGQTFLYHEQRAAGEQRFAEATDLSAIGDESYDFVVSAHMLEHTANPLRAVCEWLRILRVRGTLIVVVPNPMGTFDHRRPITTFEHVIADYRRGATEDDLTHWPEIARLHDLSRDPGAGNAEEFQRRSLRNAENRCLHHHVFDAHLLRQILAYCGARVCVARAITAGDIIAISTKAAGSSSRRAGTYT